MTKLDAVNWILRRVGLRTISALETGSASTAADVERVLDEWTLRVLEQNWHFNKRRRAVMTADANGHLLFLGSTTISSIAVSVDGLTTVITAPGHGLLNGQQTTIAATTTTPSINGVQTITWVTDDAFSIAVNVTNVAVGTGTQTPTSIISEIQTDGCDSWRNVVMQVDRLFDLDNNTDVFTGTLMVRYFMLLPFASIPSKVQQYLASEAAVSFNDAYGQRERAPALRADALRARAQARGADSRIAEANVLLSPNVQDTRGHRVPFWGSPDGGSGSGVY